MTATAGKRAGKDAVDTVLSEMTQQVSEPIAAIMPFFGIRKITTFERRVGCLSEVVPSIEVFEGTPKEIESFGNALALPIAKLMASVGLVTIEISADQGEVESIVSNYNGLVARHKARAARAESVDAAKEKLEKPVESSETTESKGDKEEKNETDKTDEATEPAETADEVCVGDVRDAGAKDEGHAAHDGQHSEAVKDEK